MILVVFGLLSWKFWLSKSNLSRPAALAARRQRRGSFGDAKDVNRFVHADHDSAAIFSVNFLD